jgi:TolB-like protein/predicted Zn-dependent protease
MAFPLPEKPSIAVLPFTNMSEEPKQEYFSDGLTEEIISALSRAPKLFVIARNSTFTYKGKPVKVQQVSEELGVRYVLEGSVRKAGDHVRVTAQLIDATTGHHLWSERYDRELKDIFALQDEITMKIIAAMQVKLTEGDETQMSVKSTENLDAYLKFLQGFHQYIRVNPDDNILAQRYFKEAIALDPEFATPYSFMGLTHMLELRWGLSKSPQKSLGQALKLAQKALALDESHATGHTLLGSIHLAKRQHEKAIAACERSVALAPNYIGGLLWLGHALNNAGRHQEAIPHFKRVIRLSPLDPSAGLFGLGTVYRLMERHEEAITVLKDALHYSPKHLNVHLNLAACYGALGKEDEVHAAAAEVLRLNPNFSLNRFERGLTYKNRADSERFINALRKAGLPDKPSLPLPDKPSIAVLPFTNMSDDPKQEYFSDGLTEEIISALSRVPKLFVIARNSTFTYKGKPVKVQKVSKELGVRYVLEGSLRKAGDRVRITAQLIDASIGHHLWSERYDRTIKDIFALQDEITMKIIMAMQVKLTEGERARVHAKGTDNLDAYLKFLQGLTHFSRWNPDDHVLARRYFEEAIALDPEYASPYGIMGHIHLWEVFGGRSKSPQESIGQAFKLSQKVLALDEFHPSGHIILGTIHRIKGQHEKAIAAFERAVALNPTIGGLFNLGDSLSYAGRPQEAIPHFKRLIRLSPLDPSMGLLGLNFVYIMMERYEEAITEIKKALHYQPDFLTAHARLAGCYAALGREEEADAEAAEVLRLHPKFSVMKIAKRMQIRDKDVKQRYIDLLRKAGLPD